MNTWDILEKELNYYGINLINSKKCQIYQNNQLITQGIIKTIKQIKQNVKIQKEILLSLATDVTNLLKNENINNNIIYDEKMKDLFIFSLKDLAKFILCFEELDNSEISFYINSSLNKDIKEFTKEQIYKLPDYKISIDWSFRLVNRLLYIVKLLLYATLGKDRIAQVKIKTAKGIAGPFSHLDLPMEERLYAWDQLDMSQTTSDKERQKRYTQGFKNYNNNSNPFEGYYWRELRNEPFSWDDKDSASPYPSRTILTR